MSGFLSVASTWNTRTVWKHQDWPEEYSAVMVYRACIWTTSAVMVRDGFCPDHELSSTVAPLRWARTLHVSFPGPTSWPYKKCAALRGFLQPPSMFYRTHSRLLFSLTLTRKRLFPAVWRPSHDLIPAHGLTGNNQSRIKTWCFTCHVKYHMISRITSVYCTIWESGTAE